MRGLPEGPRKGGRNDLSEPGERPAPPSAFRASRLADDVADAFRGHNRLAEVLGLIARGRSDCGRPLAAETSRQIARDVLTELGLAWPAGEQRKR